MRGSGLLPYPDTLDRLLDEIFSGFSGNLSIKTRLGRLSADEMSRLIPVFNRYPLSRVIVHPRTGVQMYDGTVNMAAFQTCLKDIRHPVIYNGDISHIDVIKQLSSRFPTVAGYMLGRGLIANLFLPEMIQSGGEAIGRKRQRFLAFHEDLIDEYDNRFYSQTHVLDRMKGFWKYFAMGFENRKRVLERI
jgi:tRNA-dihydrouridine synthase